MKLTALITAALLLALPLLIANPFYVGIATHVLVFAMLALSLNILLGYGGMTSLGHATYLGVPAYVCAKLAGMGAAAPLAAGGALLAGTLTAAVFGVLALRARGLGFLMITLALGQIVWGMAYRWVELTGGDNGVRLASRPHVFGIDLSDPVPFYYFTACVVAIALYFMWQLERSPYGACLRGTRDQKRRMGMLGHDTWLIQWSAFVLSGFWGSVAGLLYVYDYGFVSPGTLSLQQSAETLLMVILGGAGTLAGPVVGAVIITLVRLVASTYVERWFTLLGAIFIVVVLFMPQGIVPGVRQLLRKRRPA